MPLVKIKPKASSKSTKKIVMDFKFLIPLVAQVYNWDFNKIFDDDQIEAMLDEYSEEDYDEVAEENDFEDGGMVLKAVISNGIDDFIEQVNKVSNSPEDYDGLIWDRKNPKDTIDDILTLWENKYELDDQILRHILVSAWFKKVEEERGINEKRMRERFNILSDLTQIGFLNVDDGYKEYFEKIDRDDDPFEKTPEEKEMMMMKEDIE